MPRHAADLDPHSRQQGGKVYCAWQSLGEPGLEIVSLRRDDSGLVAEGKALRVIQGLARAFTWRIDCDLDWRTRAVAVWPTGVTAPVLSAACNGRGLWHVTQGRNTDRIAGCVDVHLACGPFSHTLPIRRLRLGVPGEEVRVRVALADPIDCSVRPARRSYTLLQKVGAGQLFSCRDLDNGTVTELLVDEFGLVQDQAGMFRMIWCA
jgi:uncharacterized protein